MTRDQALKILARRIAPRILSELTWAQFVGALSGLGDADKAEIMAAVRQQREKEFSTAIYGHVRRAVRALAITEATAMLANDSLDLSELDRVL